MPIRQKKALVRIMISAVLFGAAFFVPLKGYDRLFIYIPLYFLIGADVLWNALRGITRGQVFDENFLMAIATVGAFAIGEYPEAVAVMLFYQVGEWFQQYAVGRSRKSIAALMDIRPDYANIETAGGLVQVDPEEVKIGDVILIRPGERVPLDGMVLEGNSSLDTAALTGESLPRDVGVGEDVISGCVNLVGVLKVKVVREFGDSTVAKILDLVENASEKKANAENFITKFARYYTPAVVIAALLVAVLPPLFVGDWGEWIHRALIFLVVSCPCALVISIPLSFFGGIGGASKNGILVKGANYLEALADAKIAVFDKTGTLTEGTFTVSDINTQMDSARFLEIAALAESYSNHPIAKSIVTAHGAALDVTRVNEVSEISGRGVTALVDGMGVSAGNAMMMKDLGVEVLPNEEVGTVVYIAIEGEYKGHILITDKVRKDAKTALQTLKQQGIQKSVMLTGDRQNVADTVAAQLGIDEVYAQLLPADKVDIVERLLKEQGGKGKLLFVGDGINDAPVLARSDIGIAMGGLGSDAAIEAADVVLMDDKPSKIATAMKISQKTLAIVKQNIAFAFAIKLLVLALSAFGLSTMWEAVFADVGVSVLAILNAMRALRYKE